MIAKKIGDCCQCPKTDTYVTKVGRLLYCILCHRNNKAKQYMAKARERNLVRSLVSSPTNTSNAEHDKVYKAEMDLFWLHAAKEIEKHPFCAECELKGIKTFIPKEYYRHATAHVLSKRKDYGFPSIAANLNNFLVLSAGCGHHSKYDNSFEDAATMEIFPLAVEKVKLLYPFIAKTELKNLHEVFRQEIDL